MRRTAFFLAVSLLAIGCKESTADITGSVSGLSFDSPGTVMFGSCFIAIVKEPLDCLDVAWVTRYYSEGEQVSDEDFHLLQFTFDGDGILEGQFNVTGEATVTTKLITQENGALSEARGRAGELIVDTVERDWVDGTFDVTFDGGELVGDFSAEYCLNLKDN